MREDTHRNEISDAWRHRTYDAGITASEIKSCFWGRGLFTAYIYVLVSLVLPKHFSDKSMLTLLIRNLIKSNLLNLLVC